MISRRGWRGGQGAAEIAPLSRQIPTAFSFRFVLLLLLETYHPSFPWRRRERRGRRGIDKHGGRQGCNVHDSICRNKIKTALSLFLSLSPLLLPPSPPSIFHLQVVEHIEYVEIFIANILLKPRIDFEAKKKRKKKKTGATPVSFWQIEQQGG